MAIEIVDVPIENGGSFHSYDVFRRDMGDIILSIVPGGTLTEDVGAEFVPCSPMKRKY